MDLPAKDPLPSQRGENRGRRCAEHATETRFKILLKASMPLRLQKADFARVSGEKFHLLLGRRQDVMPLPTLPGEQCH